MYLRTPRTVPARHQANSLLSSIITAHGPLQTFNSLTEIRCKFAFHGNALELKGYGPKTRLPSITIYPQHQDPLNTTLPWTISTNLGDGDPTDRWIFTPKRVWIENAKGELLEELNDPRESCEGHVLTTKWNDLQLCYFLSYAMYNYLTMPWLFTRPDFSTTELPPHIEANHPDPTRPLLVTHPTDFPTHTRTQTFYFGAKDSLLKRFDYEVDIFGGVAAHYVFDYKRVKGTGLVFPSVRRVVGRNGETGEVRWGGQTAFWVQYLELGVVDGEGRVWGEVERVM
ncbi:hypothetical protein PRZ48_003719 [Zasmidium cellare]|uniref:Uncharacterized protein n=1 Tax=Zasmidium cellare TaxID=395010 RepID=A0ABR0EWM3_ZASCE|nr:hypothetical protein PRZ48_003719 [Zasmidium cellare]